MPALLMALVLVAAPTGPALVPPVLWEGQAATLELTRPVARIGVSGPDTLQLEPSGAPLKVTAPRWRWWTPPAGGPR